MTVLGVRMGNSFVFIFSIFCLIKEAQEWLEESESDDDMEGAEGGEEEESSEEESEDEGGND